MESEKNGSELTGEPQGRPAVPVGTTEPRDEAEETTVSRFAEQFEPLSIDDPAPQLAAPVGDAGLLLFRLSGGRLSYVEMVHPTDFCGVSVTVEDALKHWVRSSLISKNRNRSSTP